MDTDSFSNQLQVSIEEKNKELSVAQEAEQERLTAAVRAQNQQYTAPAPKEPEVQFMSLPLSLL